MLKHEFSYVKTTSTNIAINHIIDKTIHFFFEIAHKNDFSIVYHSCVMKNDEMYKTLKKYRVFIIDEIFMINDELFNFLNELFVKIQRNIRFFDDIHVIVFENLMQFFSIIDRQVFHVFQ